MIREYRTIREITGPLLCLGEVEEASYGEMAEVLLPEGGLCRGRVTSLAGRDVTVQLFDGGEGIEPGRCAVRLLGHPLRLGLSDDMFGRVFNGLGEPRDGGPAILPELRRDIAGGAEEASLRALAETPATTGLGDMDEEMPLLQGQCRAVFAEAELGQRALQTVLREAKTAEEVPFTLVLAGLGLRGAELEEILQTLDHSGAAERAVVFANLAEEPAAQRLAAPEMAMTAAEYFAFEKERPVLLLLLDMASWAEARWELAAAREETDSGSDILETELAALFERCGGRMGQKGSVTLLAMSWRRDGEEHPAAGSLRRAAETWISLEEKPELNQELNQEEPALADSQGPEAPETEEIAAENEAPESKEAEEPEDNGIPAEE